MEAIKKILSLFVKAFFLVYFSIFEKPKFDAISSKVNKLYKQTGFMETFSQIRIWDAPFQRLDSLIPANGKIIDLGCGDGILSNYLALSKPNRTILGIELNKDRVKNADKGVKNTTFIYGNIVSFKYPKSSTFVLSHVLHHLPSFSDQEKVINKCFANLKKGGRLIIAEISERPLAKYLFTWITDVITVPILFDKKVFDKNIHFRKERQWRELLEKVGFKVKVIAAHKGKPFSHIVILATKV